MDSFFLEINDEVLKLENEIVSLWKVILAKDKELSELRLKVKQKRDDSTDLRDRRKTLIDNVTKLEKKLQILDTQSSKFIDNS